MSDLTRAARDFQDALRARRVAARFLVAMEHPSEEARRNYLKDHPKAEPSQHTVKKTDKPSGGGGGDAKGVHKMMDALHADYPHLDKGDVASLKAEADEAAKKGDSKKLQKLKNEVGEWRRREDRYKAKEKSASGAPARGRRK